MIEILGKQLKLSEKIGTITAQEHWEQVEKSTGYRNEILDVDNIPECLTVLWSLFWELSRQRKSKGGMGDEIKPITYQAILACSEATKFKFEPSEVQLILELDKVYLTYIENGSGKPAN